MEQFVPSVPTPLKTMSTGAHTTDAPENVFCNEGEYWTIVYAGKLARIRDSKGLGYLARLLEDPGRNTAASRLAAMSLPSVGDRTAERDRMNVTKGIKAALRKLAARHPELGLHLQGCVKTGTLCSYNPAQSVSWTVVRA